MDAQPVDGSPPEKEKKQLKCPHDACGATFSKQSRLKDHEAIHSGDSPWLCTFLGCGRRFARKSRLIRHGRQHDAVKAFQCNFANCTKRFFLAIKLKKHMCYSHGEKEYFKCTQAACTSTFKKRFLFKQHLQEHGLVSKFKCSKAQCGAEFNSRPARKAHEKTHAGYRCPNVKCLVVASTWSVLQKHMVKHPSIFPCKVCKKLLKTASALRRHKRSHSSHKPALACPREDCQAYFSTTFNLEHHIRKMHLELFKYKCSFPGCPRTFAMRESMVRHMLRHDPNVVKQKKRPRVKKIWLKRLDGRCLPLVEDNLIRLFALRMRISHRAKVEVNLAGLFNERKIRHDVDPEVNLAGLFNERKIRHDVDPEVNLRRLFSIKTRSLPVK